MAEPFDIVTEPSGQRHSRSSGGVTMTLLEVDGVMFRRRAIKGVGSGAPQEVCWLVGELDGVRVYFDGQSIVMTRQDLNP